MKINARPPDVYVDAEAMAKIRAWTYHAKGEVSGLGLVETNIEDGRLVSVEVVDVFILKQECSGSSTELDQGEIARLMCELEKEGKADQLKLWWHSHADLQVFWSQTDDQNIERLKTGDFLLSLVVNKAWDICARLDWFSPVEVTLDDLPVHILLPETADLYDRCRAEVEQLVTEVHVMKTVKAPFWQGFRHSRREDHVRAVDDVFEDPFAWWDGQEPGTPFLLEEYEP